MGLDIEIKVQKTIICPHCGKIAYFQTVDETNSSGGVWYDYLESIGYYVPYEKRTEENDWYGKDMRLTDEQTSRLESYVKVNRISGYYDILGLIADAKTDGNVVTINADW